MTGHRIRLSPEIFVSFLLILVVWLAFFWPALLGTQQFGFRDTGSMYYPMFRWIDQQWQSGSMALWSPLDDFGVSVAGDSSSSLFYPGKIIFLARYFSFDLRFAWYVSLHVLLAATGAWLAARSIGCRPIASSLVGITYAFGGTVLFQTCNVVFLVGAAWLPFSLATVWSYSKAEKNETRWLVLAAVSLAMMVLGGDPQMAFMAGLTTIPLLWTTAGKRNVRQRWLAPLSIAIGGIALSSVQVLASLSWLSGSERNASSSSTSMWGALLHRDFSGLVSEPQAGTHASAIYEFSFAPWRVVESVWPNILGKFDFVTESVWASQLAGADRLWTPSIYFGVVMLLLAVERMCWSRQTGAIWKPDRQLTWLMTFFLVGSFGWYGLGWLVNELQLMRGGGGIGDEIGKSVGGLYWWLVTWIPGFSSFRYPAKFLTIAALAACLLGGRGFDSLLSDSGYKSVRRMTFRATGIGVVSALIAALIFLLENWQIRLNPVAATEVLLALVHSTVVLGVFCLVIHIHGSFKSSARPPLILLLCVADLFVANVALTGFASIHDTGRTDTRHSATLYRDPGIERQVVDSGNSTSLVDVCRLDRLTSRPRLHWLSNQRVVGSFASIEQAEVLAWKQAVNRLDEAGRQVILESCGVEQSIDSIQWQSGQSGKTTATIHRTTIAGLPRFRMVDSWSALSEIDDHDLLAVVQRTNDVLDLQVAKGPDVVVLESNRALPAQSAFINAKSPGCVTIVSEENTRIVLDIESEQDGLLLATDYFDPNWTATVSNSNAENKPVSIIRANRLMRAIPVSAGQNRVTFQYHSPGLRAGIAISASALMLAILLLLRRAPISGNIK